jgi:hypothetical protein
MQPQLAGPEGQQLPHNELEKFKELQKQYDVRYLD